MSLAILSSKIQAQESTFNRIMLAALKANLFCAINGYALKSDSSIEDIDIRMYFDNQEEDYECFLVDIHETEWIIDSFNHGTFKKADTAYYLLAGTDNAPSKLCYYFSLAYLRLCPEHLISIYDYIFSLEDIERIEQSGSWYNTWYQSFKN